MELPSAPPQRMETEPVRVRMENEPVFAPHEVPPPMPSLPTMPTASCLG